MIISQAPPGRQAPSDNSFTQHPEVELTFGELETPPELWRPFFLSKAHNFTSAVSPYLKGPFLILNSRNPIFLRLSKFSVDSRTRGHCAFRTPPQKRVLNPEKCNSSLRSLWSAVAWTNPFRRGLKSPCSSIVRELNWEHRCFFSQQSWQNSSWTKSEFLMQEGDLESLYLNPLIQLRRKLRPRRKLDGTPSKWQSGSVLVTSFVRFPLHYNPLKKKKKSYTDFNLEVQQNPSIAPPPQRPVQ